MSELLVPDEPQAVFDHVAKHLLAQGEQSAVVDNASLPSCRYRGPRGLSCAAGCVIPNETYHPGMEHNTVTHLSWFRENYPKSLQLLTNLQFCHDIHVPETWGYRLKGIAEEFGLDSSVLESE